jgi:hypothetical protein
MPNVGLRTVEFLSVRHVGCQSQAMQQCGGMMPVLGYVVSLHCVALCVFVRAGMMLTCVHMWSCCCDCSVQLVWAAARI